MANLEQFEQQNKYSNIELWPKVENNYPQVYTEINKWLNKLINGQKRQISHGDKFPITYVCIPH